MSKKSLSLNKSANTGACASKAMRITAPCPLVHKKNNRTLNNKGFLFHWAAIVIIGAFLTFVYLANDGFTLEPRGEWHNEILEQHFLEIEKELIKSDAKALNSALQTIHSLADNAGFTQPSPCGQINNTQILNDQDRWCLPNIEENFNKAIQSALPDHSSIKLQDGFLSAIGKTHTIQSKHALTSYDNNLYLPLEYQLRDYQSILDEAQSLVQKCANQDTACIQEEKLSSWQLTHSDQATHIFTVLSPNAYYLPKGDQITRQKEIVTYTLALNFAQEQLLSPQLVIEKNQDLYTITFDHSPLAHSYMLYYTDSQIAAEKQGPPNVVFASVPFAYLQSQPVPVPQASCNQPLPQLCNNRITIQIQDQTSSLFFTVTALDEIQETPITSFTTTN